MSRSFMRHAARRHAVALAAIACVTLSACGGGDDAAPAPAPTEPATPAPVAPVATTQSVAGILVAPTATASASALLVSDEAQRRRAQGVRVASAACPQVPDGYDPLAGVAITFTDASNATLATLTTDACGNFSGAVPAGVTQASAAPAGLASISQPVSAFTGASPTLVSGLPASAKPVISVLQDLGAGKVALTVTDSLTGKAVLGLNAANFAFAIGAAAQLPTGIVDGASAAQRASVGIVLDASGSMESPVGTTGKTSIQVASIATHTLLDGLAAAGDEAGVVIFSSSIFPMNDATLAGSGFSWADASGVATAAYSFSATGLTTNIAKLRPIADLYDSDSAIYLSKPNGDAVNAGTGNLRLKSGYALSGATAFYDATSSGLAMLAKGVNSRKIVVAMTDGQDNLSKKTADAVIAEAQAAGVPLYTVAFGTAAAVNETVMQRMATQSGGEYKRVEGVDLTGLFQSIQTGIRFQYVVSFAQAFTSGAALTTTVTAAGASATRTLTLR